MSETLASVLVSLQDRQLLIPEVALVEVEPMSGLIVEARKESWLLGHKHWSNQRIPVIAFEILAGGHLRKHSEKARIAIFQCSDEVTELRYWGMLIQGDADKLEVSEDDLKLLSDEPSSAECACISLQEKPVSIPNLAFIEQQLLASGVTH